VQYIISTTLLATVLRKVVKYRDVNPPTTESSKRENTHAEERNTVGEDHEVLTNTLLREQDLYRSSAWGTTPTTIWRKRIQPTPGI
jgi:hypothetical protein